MYLIPVCYVWKCGSGGVLRGVDLLLVTVHEIPSEIVMVRDLCWLWVINSLGLGLALKR